MIKIHTKYYKNLLASKKRVEEMSTCTVVGYPVIGTEQGIIKFDATKKSNVCYGLDAPGDLSGGFKLIKEGLLKDVDFELGCIKDELEELGVEIPL